MFLMRFTERAYVAYSEEDVKNSFRSAVRLTFSNSHFNPTLGADLYNEYLAPKLSCWATRCRSSTTRSAWLRNWQRST